MPVIDLGRVIGPQGPQGDTGAQGIRGEQGLPGPNQVTNSTATPLTGVLTGNGSIVGVESIDAAPTPNSTGFATSGGTDKAIKGRVPVYGKGVNLLRNWYFVGGGTGSGVFPVNQRGVTSGTFDTNYKINAWKFNYNGTAGSFSLGASGMTITVPDSSTARIAQYIDGVAKLSGRMITASVVFSDGTYDVGTITRTAGTLQTIGNYARFLTTDLFELTLATATKTFVAACLEFGTEQTLFHLENGSPVLNYIPDYEYELYRCMTSTADSSDTLANKSLATEQEIAFIETGTTSARRYEIDDYFCFNGNLCHATSVIPAGNPITPGTNCEYVRAATEIIKGPSEMSGTSFSNFGLGFLGTGLQDLYTNIASKTSGVVSISTGGPGYFAVLGKLNDSNFGGIAFTYASGAVVSFRVTGGTCYVRRIKG